MAEHSAPFSHLMWFTRDSYFMVHMVDITCFKSSLDRNTTIHLVWPNWGSGSKPIDHERTLNFHATDTLYRTQPSVICMVALAL